MKKIALKEVCEAFHKCNESNEQKELRAVVVISEKSLNGYDETARSYEFSSNNSRFKPNKISNSVYGNCLDGKDLGVRLDWYVYGLGGDRWEVDYCYLLD